MLKNKQHIYEGVFAIAGSNTRSAGGSQVPVQPVVHNPDVAPREDPHDVVLLRRDLVANEVEAVVHLDFVGVDDLAAEHNARSTTSLDFACGRRAHHHHNLALARHSALHACTHTTVAVVKLSSHLSRVVYLIQQATCKTRLPSQFDLCAISTFLVSVQFVWWICELLLSKTKNISTVRRGRKIYP
jgi:hypothetical protein